MRNMILALLSASGIATLGAAPVEAVGTRYPFCIQGPEQPGLSNCTFVAMSNARPRPRAGCVHPQSFLRRPERRSARLSRPWPREPATVARIFGLFDD